MAMYHGGKYLVPPYRGLIILKNLLQLIFAEKRQDERVMHHRPSLVAQDQK